MRPPPLAVALLLLTCAACSSGSSSGSSSSASSAAASQTALPSPGVTATDGASGATGPGASGASGASGAVGATAAPGASGAAGATGSAAPRVPAPGTSAGVVPAGSSIAVGTYTLDTTGTVTIGVGRAPQDASGVSTLTASAPAGGTQHTVLHNDQGDTEQDLVFRSSGLFAAGLKIANQAFIKEFRPASPVLLVPTPARGAWSWTLTSTDKGTTAKADNQVLRTETLTIGGVAVPCVVVGTHLVLSGEVDYDAMLTTWYSPDYRLPVKDTSKGKGTFSGIPFSTDLTSVMRSVRPA